MNYQHIKNLLFLCIIIITVSACGDLVGDAKSQYQGAPINWKDGEIIRPGDESSLSSEQKAAYRLDAEKLAIRYINNTDSTKIGIPKNLEDLLYNGLVHIVNSEDANATKVTDQHQIHARIPSNPREILVYADTTNSWIDAWKNGQTETGNENIDSLVTLYSLGLVEYTERDTIQPPARARLRAEDALNVYGLARQFKQLEEIKETGVDWITDGNEINVIFYNDRLRYLFELGFGDCPSGCINSHFWYFDVFKSGDVGFVGEEGDPLEDA